MDCHYCTVLALPAFYHTKLERTLLEAGFMSITNALYFSMWNNTKGWPMYIMLSIQATVYTDSNDKYTSIFNVLKRGLSSEFKYSVKYLQVFGVWYQGASWTYSSIKVFHWPSAERSTGFSCLHRGQKEGWPVRAMVPPVTTWFILVLVRSDSTWEETISAVDSNRVSKSFRKKYSNYSLFGVFCMGNGSEPVLSVPSPCTLPQ